MGATAGTAALASGNPSEFFSDDKGATSVLVRCTSGTAEINVPGLHADGEFFPIPSGQEYVFRLMHMGIKKINGQGSGGAANVSFGTLAKTVPEF